MSIYSRIVVPLDFSECSHEALRQACELARRFDSELHLLHIVEPWPAVTSVSGEFYADYDSYVAEHRAEAQRTLDGLPLPEHGSKPIVRTLVEGHPAHEIMHYAAEQAADLIVLGTHGRKAMTRWLMGSVTERVVRHASCPVLVARSRKPADAA